MALCYPFRLSCMHTGRCRGSYSQYLGDQSPKQGCQPETISERYLLIVNLQLVVARGLRHGAFFPRNRQKVAMEDAENRGYLPITAAAAATPRGPSQLSHPTYLSHLPPPPTTGG